MTAVQPPAVSSTTLGDLFGEIAAREPDALAYVEGDERMTYADWVARADSLLFRFSRSIVSGGAPGRD
jgi:non-ribosomal peptide synthetase component E (peptide arylation enzyme)